MKKNKFAIFLIIVSVFFAHVMIASTKLAQLEVNVITAALFRFIFGLLIISPIIISLGYFIILGELRYVSLINYLVIIVINCVFLIPFSILILFTKLKNIFLNFNDIKRTFRISEKNFIKIIYPLIQKNIPPR